MRFMLVSLLLCFLRSFFCFLVFSPFFLVGGGVSRPAALAPSVVAVAEVLAVLAAVGGSFLP